MANAMTKAEILAAMKGAGFQPEHLSLTMAREIVDGDRACVSWSHLDDHRFNCRYGNEPVVTVFRLDNFAAWSSQSGSTYTRSNQRRLLEDYPKRVVELSYSHGESLIVLLAGLDADLCRALIGLKQDYPVYDESDMSQLEHDLACEAWDAYLRMDLRSDLGKVFTGDDGMPDLDTLDVSDDELRDLFYHKGEPDTGEYREPIDYEAEGADTVIFREADEVTAAIIALLRKRWQDKLAAAEAQAYQEDIALERCEGQQPLSV